LPHSKILTFDFGIVQTCPDIVVFFVFHFIIDNYLTETLSCKADPCYDVCRAKTFE